MKLFERLHNVPIEHVRPRDLVLLVDSIESSHEVELVRRQNGCVELACLLGVTITRPAGTLVRWVVRISSRTPP